MLFFRSFILILSLVFSSILFVSSVATTKKDVAQNTSLEQEEIDFHELFDEDEDVFGTGSRNQFTIGVGAGVHFRFYDKLIDHVKKKYAQNFIINENFTNYVASVPLKISLGIDTYKLGHFSINYSVNPFDVNSEKQITKLDRGAIAAVPLTTDGEGRYITQGNGSNLIMKHLLASKYHERAIQNGIHAKKLHIKHTHQLGIAWRTPTFINFNEDCGLGLLFSANMGFADIWVDYASGKKKEDRHASLNLLEIVLGTGINFVYQIEDIARVDIDFSLYFTPKQWSAHKQEEFKSVDRKVLSLPYIDYSVAEKPEYVDNENAKRSLVSFGFNINIQFKF